MGKNILVVEDDKHTQELMKFYFTQVGYPTQTCSDAYSALSIINEGHFDLILLDLGLPMQNGLSVLRSVRENAETKNIPVIVYSSDHDQETILRASRIGCTDYMIKPASREDLLERVKKALGTDLVFESYSNDENDTDLTCSVNLNLKIKSVSREGLILETPCRIENEILLSSLKSQFLENLGIALNQLTVLDQESTEKSKTNYFIPFIGLKREQIEKVTEWVVTKKFRRLQNQ